MEMSAENKKEVGHVEIKMMTKNMALQGMSNNHISQQNSGLHSRTPSTGGKIIQSLNSADKVIENKDGGSIRG